MLTEGVGGTSLLRPSPRWKDCHGIFGIAKVDGNAQRLLLTFHDSVIPLTLVRMCRFLSYFNTFVDSLLRFSHDTVRTS